MLLTPLRPTELPAGGELHALVDDVWARIARSLDGRWTPWSLPMLATLADDGPRARVLALRAVHAAARTLVFHADARSDKVREVVANPRVCVVFWDPDDGIEARFTGIAELHHVDAVAHDAWQGVSPLRRLASRGIDPPGTHLHRACRLDALAAQSDAAGGYENFAVIEVVAERLDWLWVGAEDLRRASFAWTGAGWAGSWTIP